MVAIDDAESELNISVDTDPVDSNVEWTIEEKADNKKLVVVVGDGDKEIN